MKMKMILLLLLSFPLAVTAQLSEDVAVLYDQLNTREEAAQNYIGKGTTANAFDSKFESISGIATENDLYYIAVNGIPILKNYALNELVNRKSTKLKSLFSTYLLSNEKFTVTTGVLTAESNLATQLYNYVAYQKEKALRKKYYDKTTKKSQHSELKVLFGRDYDTNWTITETETLLANFTQLALAKDDIAVETLNRIFYLNEFKSTNYLRVKYFAAKHQTKEILAALANFKNPADLPLLHQHFDKAYLAITRFPNATFLPKLKEKAESDFENLEFQQALTAYGNKESEAILEVVRKKITANNVIEAARAEKLYQLYGIIERKNAPVYNTLLARIEKNL